jgi:Cof subfamily protein (haloacid dehalogenase superfamily)
VTLSSTAPTSRASGGPGAAPRLVASDLDGTLVRSDGSISARTRDVLARVEEAGALFVMVTGRPPRWMAPVAEQTGHRGLAVCANGALVYDLHRERVVRDERIDGSAALQVVQALRDEVPGIAFAVEKGLDGFGRESSYVPRWDNGEVLVAPIEQLVEHGVVKLLARVEGTSSDDLLAVARTVVGDLGECTHSSDDGLLEISASGVSKASGLAALAEEWGIAAAEVIAFGDMPNDLPMLAWAGHSVGMGNAHPDVLAVVDEVTGTNDDDGVPQVLERWF